MAESASRRPRVRRGALVVDDLAGRIAEALADGRTEEAWRWILQFVDDFRGSAPGGQATLTAKAPRPTGARHYDALLAALVEHLCTEARTAVPTWTGEPERFAEPWWFVAGLPGYRAAALRDSPISFKRHGVFVTAGAFDRV
jgi:hypothetical protein